MMLGASLHSLIILLAISWTPQLRASENIMQTLGLKPGLVRVISQNSEACAEGPFRVVGKPGEEVLMLGPVITLSLPLSGKEVLIPGNKNQCAESVKSVIVNKELQVTTVVDKCPPNLKSLQNKAVETLSVSGTVIQYQRTSDRNKKILCKFQWGEK